MCKVIIKIIFYISLFIHAKDKKIHPLVKSAIIPGWGEKSIGKNDRARFFLNTEISLWTICFSTFIYANHTKNIYTAYAAEHAGITSSGKSHKYWVDIGNYIDYDAHNSEHLRWRSFNELYDEEDSWQWDSLSSMEKFENYRIKSDMLFKTGGYVIGAIILNRVISSINVLYLIKLENIKNISFYPAISKEYYGLQFKFVL
mgnify:CR=1 FL=1